MADFAGRSVRRQLRKFLREREGSSETDQVLLQRFSTEQNEDAFALLLQRHGPMVIRVTRRVLDDQHLAEDVFQATFMVLARKAGALLKPQSLGCWLHGVAYRLSMKARVSRAREHAQRQQWPHGQHDKALDEMTLREAREMLDEELVQIPERHRQPLILCYLEGKSRQEAADELGCSVETLKKRLDRGRELLRGRLLRRQLTFTSAIFATLLTQLEGQAQVPVALEVATIDAALPFATASFPVHAESGRAVTLAQGFLSATAAARTRVLALVALLLAIAGSGASLFALQALDSSGRNPAVQPQRAQESAGVFNQRHGDPLPAEALERLGTLRLRHPGPVWSVAVSPDGSRVASAGGRQQQLVLWDGRTGERCHTLEVLKKVGNYKELVFSPDGKQVAVARYSYDAQNTSGPPVCVFDVDTGAKRLEVEDQACNPTSLAYSPDGKLLAVGNMRNGSVELHDARTGKKVQTLGAARSNWIYLIAFSADGREVAAIREDHLILWWESATGKELGRFKTDGINIEHAALSPDLKQVASYRPRDGKQAPVRIWDLASGREVRSLPPQSTQVEALAFAPDGGALAAAFPGERICLFDVASGKLARTLGERVYTRVSGLRFSGDSRVLLVRDASQCVHLLDVRSGKNRVPLMGHQSSVAAVAHSPDGKLLASTAGWSDSAILLWNRDRGEVIARLETKDPCAALAFSPDSKTLAAASRDILLWPIDQPEHAPRRLKGVDKESFQHVAISPDGQLVAGVGGFYDANLRVWRIADGKLLYQFGGANGWTPAPAFSSDSKHIVWRPVGDSICVMDALTGKVERRLGDTKTHVRTLACSSDGRFLVSTETIVHDDGLPKGTREVPTTELLRVRRWESGKICCELQGFPVGSRNLLALTPDDKTLAVQWGSDTLRLIETSSGLVRGEIKGHRADITCVEFAPDGRTLTTGSQDTTLLVWDLVHAKPDAERDLDALWQDLAAADAGRAYRSIWKMRLGSKRTITFLAGKLKPVSPVPADKLEEWIADLDSEVFVKREKATKELEQRIDVAGPALRRSLDGRTSLELRRRVETLLDLLDRPMRSTVLLQAMRGVEVLEGIGSIEAKHVLSRLASGEPAARLTQEARASFNRLDRKARK